MRPRAVGGYEPDNDEQRELVDLWHLSRTALACDPDQSRNARLRWVVDEYMKLHPDVGRKWVYVWAVDNLGLHVARWPSFSQTLRRAATVLDDSTETVVSQDGERFVDAVLAMLESDWWTTVPPYEEPPPVTGEMEWK